ncbi:MAG: flagellar biosynthetic protein FliO [Bacillota bacterium]
MEGEFWKALLRIAIFLPLVLLLAYWSIKLAAVRGPFSQGSKNMQIIERLPLTTKNSLYVVKLSEQYFLIGVSEQRVELLKELSDYPEIKRNSSLEWERLQGSWIKRVGLRGKE